MGNKAMGRVTATHVFQAISMPDDVADLRRWALICAKKRSVRVLPLRDRHTPTPG